MPRPGDGSVWMCPAAVDAGQKYFFAYAMNMRMSTWQSPTPDKIGRIGSWSTVVFMADAPGAFCSVLPAAAAYSPVARHRGRVNISFLDGHVASFTGQEVGCGIGDPQRFDLRWIIPYSSWNGPGG
jgi:prepilin-type processing-associated H-X9-DG protein